MDPIKSTDEFFTVAKRLIESWCDSRQLSLLSILLPAYLNPNPLTDGWYERYDALKNLRAAARQSLPDDDWDAVNELVRFAERMVHPVSR